MSDKSIEICLWSFLLFGLLCLFSTIVYKVIGG